MKSHANCAVLLNLLISHFQTPNTTVYVLLHQDDHSKPVQWTHQHTVTMQNILVGNEILTTRHNQLLDMMEDGCLDQDME